MFNSYNPVLDLDRRIEDLQRLKSSYQAQNQPIQNIINTNASQTDFEARYVNENDKVSDFIVQKKTAFIDLKKGKLSIKEINGDISEYDLVIPKTPEQLKIEDLERRLSYYEQQFDNANNESGKQRTSNTSNDESTTETSSRTIPKKSKSTTSTSEFIESV